MQGLDDFLFDWKEAEELSMPESMGENKEKKAMENTVIVRTGVSASLDKNAHQEETLKKCMRYHSVRSEIIEDDLGELWLNIEGTLKNVARALDFFTKECLISVSTFQHGHLFKVYLLSSSQGASLTSHKKRFEIRVERAESFGFKFHAKVNAFFGHGGKEDPDSLTELGSELDENGNEIRKSAKRIRTNSVKSEPEPVECVNCKILREERRNADNEIIRREKEKQALVNCLKKTLDMYLLKG